VKKSRILVWVAAAFALSLSAAVVADADLLRSYCSGCHKELNPGKFDRISAVRKSPEGWTMTLFRMRQVHGLNLPEDVRDQIVRELSDSQGLAPSEAAAGRFALERRPNVKDIELDPETNVMCGRCHSIARSSLQRRDEAEWLKLAHMHLGQWPSLEYQASSRDRPWWAIASGKMPAQLAARWGYSSEAWTSWSTNKHRGLEGRWIFTSHATGGRDYHGVMTVSRTPSGDYRAVYELTDSMGQAVSGTSSAIVYTGYEWRGTADFGGLKLREVYAADESGIRLAGRWFDADHPEVGGDTIAIREDADASIIAMEPRALKIGYAGPVTLIGPGIDKSAVATFGPGVSVGRVTRAAGAITVDVRVEEQATPGMHAVRAGNATATIPVYRQVDAVSVNPSFAIARLGGGKTPPVAAQFEAIATSKLDDGTLLPLGPIAATWSTHPFDDEAKRTADEKFAGQIDANGQFHPAGAGPNRDREFSGNNVGNLKVTARSGEGITADAHLIVTVQRWNNAPIY
jgi:quinohemoprotein amine dehydrogenase